jgi:hypothetical protein
MKKRGFFLLFFVAFLTILFSLNRIFFKQNDRFCIGFLYPSGRETPEDMEPLSPEVENILRQKFHYFAKGCHCYAFLSEDEKYVLKFHRYASHMRRFSWVYHPFSYLFKAHRKEIKKYNIAKLQSNFRSYKESYAHLKEETGLIWVKLNRSKHLHQMVTLVDSSLAEYQVPLDDVTVILQHKADLIYPRLNQCIAENNMVEAKKIISAVIGLVIATSQKGFIDEDPVLRKNYGLFNGQAIHIDIGDLVKNEAFKKKENLIAVTQSLRDCLEGCPTLLQHYYQLLDDLEIADLQLNAGFIEEDVDVRRKGDVQR